MVEGGLQQMPLPQNGAKLAAQFPHRQNGESDDTRVDAWVRVVPLTIIAKGAILELDHVAVVTAARAAATAATSVHRTIPYIRVWLLRNDALLKLWRKCQRTAAT